jgi:hypothetical protein
MTRLDSAVISRRAELVERCPQPRFKLDGETASLGIRQLMSGPRETCRRDREGAERPGNRDAAGEKRSMRTVGSSPQAFASFIRQDIAIWKEVADQAKVEVK